MRNRTLFVSLAIFVLSFALICVVQNPALAQVTTTFSFASDTFHQGPTFKGYQNRITSEYEFDLLVDLNSDNYGGQVAFLSKMVFTGQTYDYRVYAVGPQYLHVWKVNGSINFYHINTTNTPLLTINFREAVLTSWSPSSTLIGETMTLQDSQSADPAIGMISQPLLVGIGVLPEYLTRSQDFAYTFTHVRPTNVSTTPLVRVDNAGNLIDNWASEGSFSASACY